MMSSALDHPGFESAGTMGDFAPGDLLEHRTTITFKCDASIAWLDSIIQAASTYLQVMAKLICRGSFWCNKAAAAAIVQISL